MSLCLFRRKSVDMTSSLRLNTLNAWECTSLNTLKITRLKTRKLVVRTRPLSRRTVRWSSLISAVLEKSMKRPRKELLSACVINRLAVWSKIVLQRLTGACTALATLLMRALWKLAWSCRKGRKRKPQTRAFVCTQRPNARRATTLRATPLKTAGDKPQRPQSNGAVAL